jgi:superfamily II DNA or RNA helicase
MARPTHSFTLFAQQFGRALRLLPGKSLRPALSTTWATWLRHNGPPDRERAWSLDRRERKGAKLAVSGHALCGRAPNARRPMSGSFTGAPSADLQAGTVVTSGDKPEFVDGDLIELDGARCSRQLTR